VPVGRATARTGNDPSLDHRRGGCRPARRPADPGRRLRAQHCSRPAAAQHLPGLLGPDPARPPAVARSAARHRAVPRLPHPDRPVPAGSRGRSRARARRRRRPRDIGVGTGGPGLADPDRRPARLHRPGRAPPPRPAYRRRLHRHARPPDRRHADLAPARPPRPRRHRRRRPRLLLPRPVPDQARRNGPRRRQDRGYHRPRARLDQLAGPAGRHVRRVRAGRRLRRRAPGHSPGNPVEPAAAWAFHPPWRSRGHCGLTAAGCAAGHRIKA
jgi:hypothetical protein